MDNKEKNQIPIYFVDNNGLFDNFQDLRTLRVDYKIVASPIGFSNIPCPINTILYF